VSDKIDTSPDAVEQHINAIDPHGYAQAGSLNDRTIKLLKTLSARVAKLEAERGRLEAAIKRQAGAAKTLRNLTLDEVQHIRDKERKEYVATKTLSSERDANSILTDEVDALLDKLDREVKTSAKEAAVWDENCRILQARAEAAEQRAAELEAKLAKAEEFAKLAEDNLTNLQPKIANGLVHKDWIPVFDGDIDPVIEAARATLAEIQNG